MDEGRAVAGWRKALSGAIVALGALSAFALAAWIFSSIWSDILDW